MEGELATDRFFRPLETFSGRFGELLGAIRDMGFDSVEIYQTHLNGRWATSDHIGRANELLQESRLSATALSGDYLTDEATFRVMRR